MKKTGYMSWENFCTSIVVEGQQRTHRVCDSPNVDFFWDGVTRRVGMLLETAPDTAIPPDLLKFSFLSFAVVTVECRHLLEVSTDSEPLMRQFYHFAEAVAERMISCAAPALDSVGVELQSFADLLAERAILSVERQIGLIGELLFLERLVASKGVAMLDTWGGPDSEPHDFRLDMREFEVKTTVAPRRIHTIHGAEQLVPSEGCSLFLLSILIGPPGATSNFSLSEKVKEVERRLAADANRQRRFCEKLERIGLRRTDLAHYGRKYSLRRALAVVPVDARFPAITRPVIQKAMGPLYPRIESLRYSVNIEGLEKEEQTREFAALIPW